VVLWGEEEVDDGDDVDDAPKIADEEMVKGFGGRIGGDTLFAVVKVERRVGDDMLLIEEFMVRDELDFGVVLLMVNLAGDGLKLDGDMVLEAVLMSSVDTTGLTNMVEIMMLERFPCVE